MKLYLSPGACSMSCHIVFEELGLSFEPMISKSDDVARLNPMGAVPVLALDHGAVLTQNLAIHTYACEMKPESNLMPKSGTLERAQVYQWLSFVSSDLHPAFGPLFGDDLSDAERTETVERCHQLLAVAEGHLQGKTYLVGERFSPADAYLFTVFGWTQFLEIPTDSYPNLKSYQARIFERPSVQRAMKREGLIK